MLTNGDTPGGRIGPITYRPGSGLAIVGPNVVLFLPEPADHPVLDVVADLVFSASLNAAAEVTLAVMSADLPTLPPFVLLVHEPDGYRVVARGDIAIELDHAGAVTQLDPSTFSVVLEHRSTIVPDAIRLGAIPDHGLFNIGGVGIVPADGLLIGGSPTRGPWSRGRGAGAKAFDRTGGGRAFDQGYFPGTDPVETDDEPAYSSDFDIDADLDLPIDPDFEIDPCLQTDPDLDLDDGPLVAVADLFGTPAIPAAAGTVGASAAELRPDRDLVDAPMSLSTSEEDRTSPVARSAPEESPPAAVGGDLGPVAVPNATNMPSKTEIDRLREQLRSDVAAAGHATPHASASLVRGRGCPNGHLNEFTDATCRQCGEPIPFDAVTTTGPRPRLGRLEFDNGQVVNLDRPVVIGRNPPSDHVVGGETANPVTVTDIDMRISSFHVRVYFEGWNVVAENPGSTNTTWVSLPTGQRAELKRGQPMVIRPGTTVTLADRRSFTFLIP